MEHKKIGEGKLGVLGQCLAEDVPVYLSSWPQKCIACSWHTYTLISWSSPLMPRNARDWDLGYFILHTIYCNFHMSSSLTELTEVRIRARGHIA